ncbi:PREDICTED: myosin-M heavy chain-like isoform X2 [Amphimedon queenslandica]|uniref:Uncharacterized protein n=1 Tax=Amphimedon queenslandica TaxID=400682 RepID=A0A1X7V0P8_AMPQE|nr:PREDICTED: myosin-M heavy chain-like isoform X2 [Amphimedon queenslandica]|eukprot:XP_003386226.1 PREDICTED: myosin-M heavy chain-like isoform X2 [Amphimedon queenslandica]
MTSPHQGGAYSTQYQYLEQERLRKLHEEHYQATITMRSRAQMLSKQTIQRKKALEQKKVEMAKAEEERRKKALEERRKVQQEATDRFRSAIYRNVKPSPTAHHHSSHHTPKLSRSSTSESHKTHYRSSSSERSGTKKERDDRIILGPNVEILHSHNTPTLDEVLETIRGRKQSHSSAQSFFTPEPPPPPPPPVSHKPLLVVNSQPSFTVDSPTNHASQITPTKILFPVLSPENETTLEATPTKEISTELLEESTISSSSSSLHDSLDSPCSPSSPQRKNEDAKTENKTSSKSSESDTDQTTPTPSEPSLHHKVLNLTIVPSASPLDSPDGATPTKEDEEKKIVGILKRPSEIMDATLSSSTMSNQSVLGTKSTRSNSTIIKKVRFIDEFQKRKSPPKLITANGFLSHTYPTGAASPKMKISLASPSSSSPSNAYPQKSKNPRNGLYPSSTYEEDRDSSHSPRSLSPQLITLPVDRTILDNNRTPTDEEINSLWRHINAYLNKPGEDTPSRESHTHHHISRGIRCRNSHHPVKLWRRQQQQKQQQQQSHHEEHATANKQVSAPLLLATEESRLIESIDAINEKLKGRVMSLDALEHSDKKVFNELPRPRNRYNSKLLMQTTPTTNRQYLQYR